MPDHIHIFAPVLLSHSIMVWVQSFIQSITKPPGVTTAKVESNASNDAVARCCLKEFSNGFGVDNAEYTGDANGKFDVERGRSNRYVEIGDASGGAENSWRKES